MWIHRPTGSDGRPSFTALLAMLMLIQTKYIADSRVQTSRQEMIADLYDMSKVSMVMFFD
jgi:eukaryotic translation initiation factor 2C